MAGRRVDPGRERVFLELVASGMTRSRAAGIAGVSVAWAYARDRALLEMVASGMTLSGAAVAGQSPEKGWLRSRLACGCGWHAFAAGLWLRPACGCGWRLAFAAEDGGRVRRRGRWLRW